MMRRGKAFVFIIFCMALLLVLAACGGRNNTTQPSNNSKGDQTPVPVETDELEPITITFFDKNYGNPFTNDVAKEITRITGVNVEIIPQTGNVEEKLNLMLAGGDYPDVILMDRSSTLVNKYIAAGAVIPLNELIDQYGADIKEMYGDTLNRSRSFDGKNYYLSNWYGPDTDPMYGFLLRKDWLNELAPDKAEGEVSFTGSEFIQLLRDFKDRYPEVDGNKTIPITMNGENMTQILGAFKGMFGVKTYYETADGLQFDVFDPKYKDMLLYMNTLHNEKLLDTNWAVMKEQIWEQQLSTGNVFATPAAYWDTGNVNNAIKDEANPDKAFYAYKVVADGLDPAATTYSPRNMLGWDAIMITKKNQYPERTMQFFNFLSSEEGQYLMQWGVEGLHWEMVDGKHTPKPIVFEQLASEGYSMIQNTGIRNWTWSVNNGVGKDGTPFDLQDSREKLEGYHLG
jgi:putative aldouronate transport system substrate-binding protein